MKENNLIMKSEGNKSNNNDSSFTRNSSSTSQPTTGNKTTFKDWWKYLKWFLIIGIIGLLIFTIWYLSVPHYSVISLNSQGITYGSKIDDKGNKQEWLELHYGKNTANKSYKCSNHIDAEYYVTTAQSDTYKFFFQSVSYGKICVLVKDIIVNDAEIIVGEEHISHVLMHKLYSSEFEYTYALTNNAKYVKDGNNIWVQVDGEVDEQNLNLINHFNIAVTDASTPTSNNFLSIIIQLLPTVLMVGLFFWYFSKLYKMQGGSDGESIWSVGKSQAKIAKSNVKFNDVAGLKEEKEELIEVVDYLKNPNKYAAMGARAPKGVILYGPPGTGKTLLAKAVAGEAKVPFFQVTGSSFEDMLVGVGAKRVRDLFNNAKKTAPSIIFIDEFDSVAAKRGKIDIAGGGAGIADQTINQLLAEMDGFNTKSGIVVIAATNRLDVLDNAVLRPGRFDRHVQVNLPDLKEREAILNIHAKNKNISSKVNLADIARRTPGFSGAQLENVLNEATLLTVRNNKPAVGMKEIDEAIDRVIAGPAKHTRVITEDEKKQIAYHEAGHALVGLNMPGSDVVEKITIIPRGQAAGYTLVTPEKQELSIQKKSDLLAIITATLGGRAAEEVVYGKDKISTGASNDLLKVTNIARAMTTQLGMTDIGMTQFIPSEGTVNPYSKSYSESTALKIDSAIEKIIQDQYAKAKQIIKSNKEELDLIVESLLVLETIVKDQIDYIHKNKKLPIDVIEKKKQMQQSITSEVKDTNNSNKKIN